MRHFTQRPQSYALFLAIIVEVKSVEKLNRVHWKQLLTYLRFTRLKLGLLINFGEENLKDGVRRIVNGLIDRPLK